MTDYRIVCRTLSDDESHIEQVGLINPDGDPKNADFSATPKEVNTMIGNDDTCYFTTEDGQRAEVTQHGDDYISTTADGTIENNLRHLRECRGFSSK